ncbi:hypothetical protein LCGC14_0959400 [marine sediment metagenome]|uniref:Uncharacterized protein n=1 Tax=marine sediment metagenome TaxID=412755 RepID=A0A0F9QY72_9ZZZZ
MPVGPVGPNNVGVDFNHWQRVSSFNNTSYKSEANVAFRLKGNPKDIILTLEGSVTVFYSFNGNTDHGELITTTDRSQMIFHRRPATRMWFRVASGSGTVTVEAWASQ